LYRCERIELRKCRNFNNFAIFGTSSHRISETVGDKAGLSKVVLKNLGFLGFFKKPKVSHLGFLGFLKTA
jgi:hypothetical protein